MSYTKSKRRNMLCICSVFFFCNSLKNKMRHDIHLLHSSLVSVSSQKLSINNVFFCLRLLKSFGLLYLQCLYLQNALASLLKPRQSFNTEDTTSPHPYSFITVVPRYVQHLKPGGLEQDCGISVLAVIATLIRR